MVAMSFERRPTYGGMEGFLHDVFRWSTVIGVTALGAGMAVAGQAFRGNGFDEIIFGPAAVLLLAVAAVALHRALRTAESESVAHFGGYAFAAGVDSYIRMAWWLFVAVALVASFGLAWVRSRLQQPGPAGEPEGAAGGAADAVN